jgi:uncharacterized membrane protein
LGMMALPFAATQALHFSLQFILFAPLPALFDGLIQAYSQWESNNLLRLITGLLAGLAFVGLVSLIGNPIAYWLKQQIFI